MDFLQLNADIALCNNCGGTYPVSPSGVLIFFQGKTGQNIYFDNLYFAGLSHANDKLRKGYSDAFVECVNRAERHLKLCGFDSTQPVENLSFLDVACGSGWLTAGLMQCKNVSNCRFHALDISPEGLDMLAGFNKSMKSSNSLEMSVQNAEDMRFGDAAFDVIIGSSVLHHLDHYEAFLNDCRRILKPGGVALFGEPFAIGYALGAAALMLAQKDLGTHYDAIDAFHADIAYRVKGPGWLLTDLVDKHLFFQSQIIPLVQRAGFSSVDFLSAGTREYYRDFFINTLLLERGISDPRLAERANSIYRTVYDVFEADNFVHSIAAFVYLVMRT